MYCPNCKQHFEGKFCPECGTQLIEEDSNQGLNINLGDANAISGGINVNNTKNVQNVDNSVTNIDNTVQNIDNTVHNIDNSVHNTTQNVTNNVTNITQVATSEADLERAAEKAKEAMAEAETARLKAEEEKAKTAMAVHEHEVASERKKTNKTIAIVAAVVVFAIAWFFLRTFTRKSVVDIASDAVYNSVSHTSVRDIDVDTSDIPSDDPSVQIDSKGDVKAQLENFYEKVLDFSDGFYKIKTGNKLGIADKNGKVIQRPKYDKIFGRNDKGLIKIMNDKMIGYLNIKGVEIIEPVYTSISEEKDGLFIVEKDRKYGVINAKTMQLVAPCIYDHIFDKADNKYKVTQGTKMGYLDASGNLIEELK